MISKKEVEHIAKLARLGLSEKEIKKFRKELSSILDYVEKLKEVDLTDVEPTFHALKIENILREDKIKEEDIETIKKLIEAFPEKKDTFLKVKSVFYPSPKNLT